MLILSVVWAAFVWHTASQGEGTAISIGLFVQIVGVALLCQMSLYYHDLYVGALFRLTWESCLKIIQSIGVAAILVVSLSVIFPQWRVGMGTLVALSVLPFLLVIWRVAYANLANSRVFERRILLIGNSRLAEDVVTVLRNESRTSSRIAGRLSTFPESDPTPTRPAESSLMALVRESGVNHLVVALNDRRGKLPIGELLQCKFSGITIEDGLSFYERITGKIHLDALQPSWLIFSDGFKPRWGTTTIQRTMDIICAVAGLLILAPLGALLALIIKLDSRGPVFYFQERVGVREKAFKVMKFRSMRQGAEESTGPVWAKDGDERVTRVGRWLRTLRLDELPQMVNVLRGDMSFVGPRPERPAFVEQLKAVIPYYGFRHAVRPGITGLAQVRYHYGSSVEDAAEKLQYDLCYIKNRSLLLDLSILIDTVQVMLRGQGAR